MSPEKQDTKSGSVDPTTVLTAADFKTIYVNWIQLAGGATDFMMTVGEARPLQDGGAEVEQRARLFFNPVQAKVIVAMLANAIREYEKKFGPINIPTVLADHMKNQLEAGAGKTEGKTEGD